MTNPEQNQPESQAGEEKPGSTQQFGMGDQLAMQQYQKKTSKALWAIFALLLLLAAGVILILPNYIQAPEPAARVVVVEPSASPTAVPAMSPFEEAQRLRQREAAQNTLARLLELQEELEKKQVERWATETFNTAIDFAHQGDAAYREQQFITANTLYQQGVVLLQELQNNEMATYQDIIAQGELALQDGDAELAESSFSLALLINPDGEAAVVGLDRSAVLNDVLAIMEEANTLYENQQLEAARDRFHAAQELDPLNADIEPALRQISIDIEQRDFTAAMSRGYAALQKQDTEAATSAFKQAQNMRKDSAEAALGIQQAADLHSTTLINDNIEAARNYESAENWQAAMQAWQSALEVDANLVVATQGVQRAENRRNLDVFFNTVISEPLRLVDETVYVQTQQLLKDLQAIQNKGPNLKAQITIVEKLLVNARVPVNVQLESDGFTDVTIRAQKNMGLFKSQTLALLPGEYVAVGLREGYRDVRVEFTIGIDQTPPLITVICTESI